MRPQPELVRVVRSSDGTLAMGRALPGRGAWLCAASAPACVDLARKKKAFTRAFRAPVGDEQVVSLRSFLAERARIVGRADEGSDVP